MVLKCFPNGESHRVNIIISGGNLNTVELYTDINHHVETPEQT